MNGAEAVATAFAAAEMPAIFGVPGGGSSLDLIAAANARGIPFHLARTESGAGIMALTLAELSHRPVGVLVTRGPGVSNAANGIADASLERAPVVLVADGFGKAEARFATHQLFDQAAMMAPVTRTQCRSQDLPAGDAAAQALAAALSEPRGPSYIELSGEDARADAPPPPTWTAPRLNPPDASLVEEAGRLLARARRPAIIAGLEATAPGRTEAVRALAEALGCPVLVTYKAKGVVPDAHPLFGGVFTGGEAEAPILREADLILLLGADPIEFIPQPWRFDAPIVDFANAVRAMEYRAPALRLTGAWEGGVAALSSGAARSDWDEAGIARHRATWLAALENGPGDNRGISPSAIVRLTQAACREVGADPRVAVDAGAHMFPTTTFWQAERPGDLLISNGLATMGHALPAAIGAAIYDPARGAVALTGDGGLLMALGELATAAAMGLRLVVVVFNDATLSLIDIKKGGRNLPSRSLDWPEADFAQVMRGLGGQAWRAFSEEEFSDALRAALISGGPALVDARCDPSSYGRQIQALRG